MSFGFSAGDFFALTQLIFKTTKALSDSAGSKAEYQGLIQTLLSLLRSINSAEELALRCSLGSADALDPNFVAPLNAIAREREICQKLIETFLVKSEKYTASFIHGSGKAKAIKKLTWRLYHADDVQNLERELSIHVDAIQFYACGLGFQSLNASLASNTLILNKIDNRTTSIYDMINQLVAMMPKVMGYSWEGGCSLDERPLRLLDALGRDLKIPALFLGSREVFHDMLEIVHRNLPGHKKIKSKEYSIADEDDEGHVVQTEEDILWSQVVKAGKTVSINMMFQTYSHNKNSEKCPRCRAVTHGHNLEGKRRRCPVCQLTFHIFEEIRFEEPEELPLPQPAPSTIESNANKKDTTENTKRKVTKTTSGNNKPRQREQDIFRRIHYVHELIQRRGVVTRSHGSQKTDKNDGKYLDDLPPLHAAAAAGDLEEVKKLLKENPEALESEGGCDSAKPLHYAAYQGRQDVAIFLLEHGAKPGSGDCDGATPLHWSIPLGQLATFRLLHESGADINARTTSGRNPLHWCAWKNQLAIAKYVLEEGVDVNNQDDQMLTALASCEGDCSELIRLLMDEGADVNATNEGQFSPLHGVVEFSSVAAVRTLLEYEPDVNAMLENLSTPLVGAMQREEAAEEVCELLIAHGANVSGIDNGVPPILQGAVDRPPILRLLITHGADIEARDLHGQTPLHMAVLAGQIASMSHLLDAGAKVNAKDHVGSTVLHFAMARSNPEIARKLIDAGASMAINKKFENPLHWVGKQSSAESIRLLAAHGADIQAMNEESKTPALIAASLGNAACLEVLIELGADVSMEDSYKSCPIHYAAHAGHLEVTEILLNAGVNVDCLNETAHGLMTPLHFAAGSNHHQVVQLLLDRGADSLCSALLWGLPLHYAVNIGAMETVRVLLEHQDAGLEVVCERADGATPLSLAVAGGELEMLKLLMKYLDASEDGQGLVTFQDLAGMSPSVEFLEEMRTWWVSEWVKRDDNVVVEVVEEGGLMS